MSAPIEQPLVLAAGGQGLVAILHRPSNGPVRAGVVVLVGGPQYRVGSHRQFVLLARALSRQGIAVLRFDYAGMGDSEGAAPSFERVDGEVRVAVDALVSACPEIGTVCLWGLCDGASSALMYAPGDPRVTRLVLLNPWVRTSEGQAQAYLENYYGRRLRSARNWRKFARNPAALLRAVVSWVANLAKAQRGARNTGGFLAKMLAGARAFRGRTLVLLSGQDLVATEFALLLNRAEPWRAAFSGDRVRMETLEAASHTFSRAEWRGWVEDQTARFLLEGVGAAE
jgi:exosortase A-associated hydrolase 1